jgi:hypothetical protein
MALSALLPWVTVKGIGLDLGLIGVTTPIGAKTVHGTDTSYWPMLFGVAAAVAILALVNIGRRALLVLGVIVAAAGAGLVYYCSNAIELASSGSGAIKQALAEALISSSLGPGPPLLFAGGVAIVAGAALVRR